MSPFIIPWRGEGRVKFWPPLICLSLFDPHWDHCPRISIFNFFYILIILYKHVKKIWAGSSCLEGRSFWGPHLWPVAHVLSAAIIHKILRYMCCLIGEPGGVWRCIIPPWYWLWIISSPPVLICNLTPNRFRKFEWQNRTNKCRNVWKIRTLVYSHFPITQLAIIVSLNIWLKHHWKRRYKLQSCNKLLV